MQLWCRGNITVDEGAKNALVNKGASLLPSGITSIEGYFRPGEAITVSYENNIIAKGLAVYSANDLKLIAGQKSQQIESILGYTLGEAAIHRDDLVLLKSVKPVD